MNMVKVGDAEVLRVEEMSIISSMALLTQNQELIEANRHWLEPRFLLPGGKRDFVFQSWIVLVDDRIVVVDPCNGNDRPHALPLFNMLKTPYIERFSATGIRPDQVDFVFCTHLHHDHCGWNTELRDGRFIPTFPNARYLFVQREYQRWDKKLNSVDGYDLNVGVFERSVQPVFEAGLGQVVNDHHRISASLDIEPAYGHTTGHSMLHLVSQMKEAYFAGDVFHHPLQVVEPALHLPGCDNLEQAVATRRRVADLCVERDALLIPAHFAAPHMGWIRRREGALMFEALIQD